MSYLAIHRLPLLACLAAAATLSLLSTGCDQQPVGQVGTIHDPVVMVGAGDQELASAVDEARRTVAELVQAMQQASEDPNSRLGKFAVKKEFVEKDRAEHMWLTELTYEDGVFTGVLNNDPQLIDNVELGEKYAVPASRVQDWLYMDGKNRVGGYSVKILQQREQRD